MKMRFPVDMYYQGREKPIFLAEKIYDVSEELGWAQRWIKRGGQEVTEEELSEQFSENVNEGNVEAPEGHAEPGYDPGHQDDLVVDEQAGEQFDSEENLDSNEVSDEDALNALGSNEEEVAKEEVKVENKKAKKLKKA